MSAQCESILQIRRLSGALGAEVVGLDVDAEQDATVWSQVRAALVAHSLLLIRGQSLDAPGMERVGQRFGKPTRPEWITPQNLSPETDKVFVLSSSPNRMRYSGVGWHSDYSFTEHPADLSWIHLHTVPDVGGDTAFASMYAAWEGLSPRMQTYLEGLYAVHDNTHRHRLQYLASDAPLTREDLARLPPVKHPIVRVHPQSGRRCLYISEALVRQILDLPIRESENVLRFLNEHCAQPEFGYRHVWQPGDLVIWDNRCVNHTAIRDYDPDNLREGFLASGYCDPALDSCTDDAVTL